LAGKKREPTVQVSAHRTRIGALDAAFEDRGMSNGGKGAVPITKGQPMVGGDRISGFKEKDSGGDPPNQRRGRRGSHTGITGGGNL